MPFVLRTAPRTKRYTGAVHYTTKTLYYIFSVSYFCAIAACAAASLAIGTRNGEQET